MNGAIKQEPVSGILEDGKLAWLMILVATKDDIRKKRTAKSKMWTVFLHEFGHVLDSIRGSYRHAFYFSPDAIFFDMFERNPIQKLLDKVGRGELAIEEFRAEVSNLKAKDPKRLKRYIQRNEYISDIPATLDPMHANFLYAEIPTQCAIFYKFFNKTEMSSWIISGATSTEDYKQSKEEIDFLENEYIPNTLENILACAKKMAEGEKVHEKSKINTGFLVSVVAEKIDKLTGDTVFDGSRKMKSDYKKFKFYVEELKKRLALMRKKLEKNRKWFLKFKRSENARAKKIMKAASRSPKKRAKDTSVLKESSYVLSFKDFLELMS